MSLYTAVNGPYEQEIQYGLYLVEDIAHQIQSYMDVTTMITSLLISKSFSDPEVDDKRIYCYENPTKKLPNWVTKVQLGENIENENIKEEKQLTYLDCALNNRIWSDGIRLLTNITHLCLGRSYISYGVLISLTKLTNLELDWSFNFDSSDLRHLKTLKSLTIGSKEMSNNDILSLESLEQLNLGSFVYTPINSLFTMKILRLIDKTREIYYKNSEGIWMSRLKL